MNIQILNIKTGTIKIKKQLAYTKTLQMALHSFGVQANNTFNLVTYMYVPFHYVLFACSLLCYILFHNIFSLNQIVLDSF